MSISASPISAAPISSDFIKVPAPVYAPEIISGPPIYGAPRQSSYVEIKNNIACHQNNLIDSLTLSDSVSYTLKLHGTFPPEIVTGPPICGIPRKSSYVKQKNNISCHQNSLSDSLSLSDSASYSLQLHGIYAPEIVTGPTIQSHPWKTTYTELSVQINCHQNSLTDSLSLADSLSYSIQHHEAYAPEIVTGPTIQGHPWKTTYTELSVQIKATSEQVTDSLTLTDSASYSLQLHGTYAPEIVTGPTIQGHPWKTTYTELSVQIKAISEKITDSLTLTDSVTSLIQLHGTYAPEIVTGPTILGHPWKPLIQNSLYKSRLPMRRSLTR